MKMNKKCSVCGNEYQSDTVYDDLGFAAADALCDSCYRKMRKQKSYKTATALIACSAFSAGDTVSVHYYYTDETGMDWYDCYVTPGNEVMYPAKHLTNFAF